MSWKKIRKENFTSWESLCQFLELDVDIHSPAFPLNLPRRLAEKIQKKTLEDPILRQFVPQSAEKRESPLFVVDPVGDQPARRAPKYLQKYASRVLLITTSACAMHCRYCFRQHFSYTENKGFQEEIELMAADTTLREVILSGGDPLSLSNRVLQELIESVEQIPHIQRLRFHTRFPIGIPERIDPELLSILEKSRLQTWFIIHCNHPRELDHDVIAALKKVQKLGIPVLNQAVLLKGVNDSIEVLQELCESLVDVGIQPYYLHQLDRVQGASHFEVSEEVGLALIEELKKRVSGYAVPKYVREVAGECAKQELVSSALSRKL